MLERIILLLQNTAFFLQAEMLLRIVIAAFCGSFIGYERTNRGKEAGIRTHTIVAIASCLIMIISQYGFADFFQNFSSPGVELRLDPSRVAAQIVSGVGFLGAGMIFIQKNAITGLTTAAGMWAVSGIGMAIGSGMYFIGIACTLVIIVVQLIMHRVTKFANSHTVAEMSFVIDNNEENINDVIAQISEFDISVLEISYNKKEDNLLEVILSVQYNEKIDKVALIDKMYDKQSIKSIKI